VKKIAKNRDGRLDRTDFLRAAGQLDPGKTLQWLWR